MRRLRVVALFLTALSTSVPAQGGPSLLVTPAQLNSELRDPRLVLLQVGPREDYDAGHIAGARFLEMHNLAEPRRQGALSLELPDESTLRRQLESLGISDQSRIVVVFGSDWLSPSTRIAWTLQAAGLGAQTRFLDGGSRAWKRAGLPLTTAAPPAATPGKLTLVANRSVVVDHRWVQARAKSPGIRLIDARSPMFYEGPGREVQGRREEAGHVAGAANIPFNSLGDDSLNFLPIDELRRRFAAAGVQPGDTVAAYCHIGQQATVVLFGARLLGHHVRLYDGSMDDWKTRNLPLENATARPPEPK
jgi:thiosulfate/3-mercaptopyruvate sulfurtransferase